MQRYKKFSRENWIDSQRKMTDYLSAQVSIYVHE